MKITRVIKKAKYDEKAFEELYDIYFSKIYSFVASRVSTKSTAEDLNSEIWIKIVQQIHNFKPKSDKQANAWIFTLARNHVIDHYRTYKIVYSEQLLFNLVDDTHPGIHQKLDDDQKIKQIKNIIKKLSLNEQECITLKYFSDLTNSEIAKLLDMKPKTVSCHLSRALQRIRKQLNIENI